MTEALKYTCRVVLAAIRSAPDENAELASELLFGEAIEITETRGHWSSVRALRDGYTGWVTDAALAAAEIEPTHRICQMSGLVFARPDIKSPLQQRLHFGSPVKLGDVDGLFFQLDGGGFIHRRHVAPLDTSDTDTVATALRFIGTPYLWGGRTCDGIDCSALVQTALHAGGIDCPRDTGDQRWAFGDAAITGELRRGDLVFFPGHVGIMVDATHLLHANAFWMTTLVEPLGTVVDRFQPDVAEPILAVVRPA